MVVDRSVSYNTHPIPENETEQQQLGFFVSGPGTLTKAVVRLATKVKVDGKALKVIEAINSEADDRLNVQRFSRLCGMLRSPETVWSVLERYGKDTIVRDAKRRLGNKAYA